MKNGMLTSLQRRFAKIEEIDFLLLDPHFKDKSFSNVTFRQNAPTLLESQYISGDNQHLPPSTIRQRPKILGTAINIQHLRKVMASSSSRHCDLDQTLFQSGHL